MIENRSSSVAPSSIKIARRMSATMMPKVSTLCWCSCGTAKVVMMITNTNRLSTERLFSTMQPAKYWVPKSPPACQAKSIPKAMATAM